MKKGTIILVSSVVLAIVVSTMLYLDLSLEPSERMKRRMEKDIKHIVDALEDEFKEDALRLKSDTFNIEVAIGVIYDEVFPDTRLPKTTHFRNRVENNFRTLSNFFYQSMEFNYSKWFYKKKCEDYGYYPPSSVPIADVICSSPTIRYERLVRTRYKNKWSFFVEEVQRLLIRRLVPGVDRLSDSDLDNIMSKILSDRDIGIIWY
jgi:hypothetical protein